MISGESRLSLLAKSLNFFLRLVGRFLWDNLEDNWSLSACQLKSWVPTNGGDNSISLDVGWRCWIVLVALVVGELESLKRHWWGEKYVDEEL